MIVAFETDLAHDTPLGPVYRILQTLGADLRLMMAEAGSGGARTDCRHNPARPFLLPIGSRNALQSMDDDFDHQLS